MIPDVTFVNLPAPYLEDALWIYPLGLVSLATYARKEGFKVDLLDMGPIQDTSFSNIMAILRGVHSPVVGVSVVTPAARYLPLFMVVRHFNGMKLVVGGPHASCLPNEMISLGFQTVVVGEGESTVHAFMGLQQGGILYGSSIDLDGLPFPDRSLAKGYKGPAPIMTSRGCPYRCTFCAKNDDMVYRRKSPENVVEEVASLPDEQVIFYDDTFTASAEWVNKLCELILRKEIKKKFRCSTRADKVDGEMLSLMRRAGFEEVCVGVESGSQKILDVLNKKTTVFMNTKARKLVADAGMKFKAYIMVGCPSESWETTGDTKAWLEENRPDSIGLYIFHPLPGSDVWNCPEKYDIAFSRDYDVGYYGGRRDGICSTVSTSFLSKREITKIYWDLEEKISR